MGTRDELHQLIASLPEEALDAARAILMQFQSAPAAPLPPTPDRIAGLEHFRRAQQRVHERMEERMREMVTQLARQK